MDWPYTRSFAILLVLQALAMLVVRDPPRPAWLRRSVVLGLLPLAGIGGGVLLLGNVPGAPERAVDLAAVATPALALLGLVAHRLRPLALAAPVLYLVAWRLPDTRLADLAADLLIIAACASLAWLSALVAPRAALAAGILVATAVDVVQIMSRDVQPVAQALSAAVPAAGLPRLQESAWGGATMGWGDVYLAALLGVVVACLPARRVVAAAIAVLVSGLAWGFMFEVWDVIPGTVPVAVALLVVLALERRPPWRWEAGARAAASPPTS